MIPGPGLAGDPSGRAGERLAWLSRHVGVALGVAAVLSLGYGIAFWHLNAAFPGDTLTYYLAGMRLNDGGYLYDLRPQDVWFFDGREFPLLGPPLIAVVWRLLVALLGEWAIVAWMLAVSFAALWAAWLSLLATRGWSGALLVALAPSYVLLVGVGNVDGLVLAGVMLAWMLLERSHVVAAGLLIGLLVSLKLTPGVLLVWLVATRRWRVLGWSLLAILVLAAVAVVGVGPDVWPRYARVVLEASAVGRIAAFPTLAVGLVLVLAIGARRRAPAFALAVALMPLGSPHAAVHSWAMLVAATAPLTRRGRQPWPDHHPVASTAR